MTQAGPDLGALSRLGRTEAFCIQTRQQEDDKGGVSAWPPGLHGEDTERPGQSCLGWGSIL